MKKTVKIITSCLLLVLIFSMVSCSEILSKLPFDIPGSSDNDNSDSDSGETLDGLVLIENSKANFKLVYTTEAGSDSIKYANSLVSRLRKLGIEIDDPIEEGKSALVTDCEIVIGTGVKHRGDELSINAKDLGKDGIVIKTVGQRVLIAGGNYQKTLEAFKHYVKNEMKIDDKTESLNSLAVSKDFSYNVTTEYQIKSIKIADVDFSEFTLVYDISSLGSYNTGVIEAFGDDIYDESGYVLEKGSIDKLESYAHAFVVRCTSDAGPEGFRAFYDGKNFIVECSYPKEFEGAFERLMNILFFEASNKDISISEDYTYKEDVSTIGKNDVDADNQLDVSQYVSYFGNPDADLRIMYVGNSITRHGPNESIGWYGDWGMAASSKDKDYVHVLSSMVNEVTDAYFCICQAAIWERNFANGSEKFELYEAARDFDADIIVMRVAENCDRTNFDQVTFYNSYLEFIMYLDKSGDADLVLTSSFWKHTADPTIERLANDLNVPFVSLSDLGEDDSMMAKDLFENPSVGMHPGDLGMQTIAERIFKELRQFITKP